MIKADKISHALVCFDVVGLIGIWCWWVGVIVAAVLAIGKEVYDKVSGKGVAEWGDLLADGVGIAIGVAYAFFCTAFGMSLGETYVAGVGLAVIINVFAFFLFIKDPVRK